MSDLDDIILISDSEDSNTNDVANVPDNIAKTLEETVVANNPEEEGTCPNSKKRKEEEHLSKILITDGCSMELSHFEIKTTNESLQLPMFSSIPNLSDGNNEGGPSAQESVVPEPSGSSADCNTVATYLDGSRLHEPPRQSQDDERILIESSDSETENNPTTSGCQVTIYDSPLYGCEIVEDNLFTSTSNSKRKRLCETEMLNDDTILILDEDFESNFAEPFDSGAVGNRMRKKRARLEIYDDALDDLSSEFIGDYNQAEASMWDQPGPSRSIKKKPKSLLASLRSHNANRLCQDTMSANDNGDLDLEWNLDGIMNDFSETPSGRKAQAQFEAEKALISEKLEQLHKSLISRPKGNSKAKNPRGLRVALMPYQRNALSWLLWREQQVPKGGLLADDMGLGKTIMMISLILETTEAKENDYNSGCSSDEDIDNWDQEKHQKNPAGGTLVVCPLSLMQQWEAEVKNHCKYGLLTVKIYHGQQRKIELRRLSKFNIVLTTYQSLVKEYDMKSTLYKIDWNRVILDEAHYIRNYKSQACTAACGLIAQKRWALTGTPLHNKEKDLYAILKFLKCSPFDDIDMFNRWVNGKNEAGNKRLILIIKTLMLRRTKVELQATGYMPSLPNKESQIIEIVLDEEEQIVYENILQYAQSLFMIFLEQNAKNGHSTSNNGLVRATKTANFALMDNLKRTKIKMVEILVLYLRLRQICCHPALILEWLCQSETEDLVDNMKETEDVPYAPLRDNDLATHLSAAENPVFKNERRSSKVRAVLNTIETIIETETIETIKIIVVSQWTSMLDVVASHLGMIKGVTHGMFTGKVAVDDRQVLVERLNDPEDDLNVLLLSLTAGGVGLNLVGANHLLLIDNHWNPQLERQAEDRIYRYGQSKNVHIYRYICKLTIEEKVQHLQKRKLEIAHQILTGTKKMSSKLTIADFKFLFGM